MTVFHGSNKEIQAPDVSFSKNYLDFGRGFYVTTYQYQAEKWLDFVCSCRKGDNLNESYDMIIGNVANDDVFKTVDMYIRGLWDKNRTIEELRYYKMNDQICIVNQEVLTAVLKFEKSYLVENK